MLRPLIKSNGKFYLKKWIIENFPAGYESMVYVEPYLCGGSILLNKTPSVSEIANDIHPELMSLWRLARDNPSFLIQELNKLTYNEATFQAFKAGNIAINRGCQDDIDGIREYVLRRMSRGGLKKDLAWSERLRRGKPGDVSGWESSIEQIPSISARINKVELRCEDAVKLIEETSSKYAEDILYYLDPPYVTATRVSKKLYDYEYTNQDHECLLDTIKGVKGKVILSGYDHPMYNRVLTDWNRHERELANNSGQTKVKTRRVEVLWTNF